MLKITDCGCGEHKSCQATFTGNKASMMERLIANLPMCGGCYTYICEYGHTHRVIIDNSKPKTAVALLQEQGSAPGMVMDHLGAILSCFPSTSPK